MRTDLEKNLCAKAQQSTETMSDAGASHGREMLNRGSQCWRYQRCDQCIGVCMLVAMYSITRCCSHFRCSLTHDRAPTFTTGEYSNHTTPLVLDNFCLCVHFWASLTPKYSVLGGLLDTVLEESSNYLEHIPPLLHSFVPTFRGLAAGGCSICLPPQVPLATRLKSLSRSGRRLGDSTQRILHPCKLLQFSVPRAIRVKTIM